MLELGLVRESLVERAGLLKTAPHLVSPFRFLLPIYGWQKRAGLSCCRPASPSTIAFVRRCGSPASGRLDDDDIAQLPRLRQDDLRSVLHYHDCQTDDARLTLAVLLDARARGADILNRRAVTAIAAARRRLRASSSTSAGTSAASRRASSSMPPARGSPRSMP